MSFSPILVFTWSCIFYSLFSYLINEEGLLFILGLFCFVFGFFSTKYLIGLTILIPNYVVYLSGILGLFISVILLNNMNFVKNNLIFENIILGIGMSLFILAGYRFFINLRLK